MKASRSRAAQPDTAHEEFETAVVVELRHLRQCEKLLQSMYPRLKSTPQLRAQFLPLLAEMQQRTQRLDAVLNPLDAMRFAPAVASAVNPQNPQC
jgi:ferritin-like metal-binding protein YciE